MAELISESYAVAKKAHNYMAWEFVSNSRFDAGELSFSELRAIALAKASGGRIAPGDKYLRAVCKEDGEVYTFKAIPELHDICLKHDLYDV